MAIDPQANDDFRKSNARTFAPGSVINAGGVQFTVVSNQGNILTLKPVTARIS
jgi:glutamate dehydrogenase/leucine dehydrogenase